MPFLLLEAALLATFPVGARATTVGGDQARRVLVFDVQPDGVAGPEFAELPDLIEQLILGHPGYTAVPDAEMHRALTKEQVKEPRCAVDDDCRKRVARELRADLIVSGSFAKEGKRYVLYLALTTGTGDGAAPVRTSEPMKNLKSLRRNVEICLTRLFQWTATPPAATEPAPVTKLGSTALPPLEPVPLAASATPKPAPVPRSPKETPAPASGTGRRSLALISVTSGEGVSDKQGRTIEETLLTALETTHRFKVIGRSDIEALLSLEAKKEAAGCTDTDCAMQIAGALGVDEVATADIGRLGRTLIINLKVIDVRSASVVSRAQAKAESDDVIPDAVQKLARDVLADIWPELAPPPLASAASPAKGGASALAAPAPVTLAPAAVTTPLVSTPARGNNAVFVATWAVLGLGVAAAVVAVGTGVTAQHCPALEATPNGIAACETKYGTITDVGWAVAGASAVTGGALFVTWFLKNRASEGAGIALEVGPTRLAIGGGF